MKTERDVEMEMQMFKGDKERTVAPSFGELEKNRREGAKEQGRDEGRCLSFSRLLIRLGKYERSNASHL